MMYIMTVRTYVQMAGSEELAGPQEKEDRAGPT